MIRHLTLLTSMIFISGCSESNQKETLVSSSIPDQESWNSTIIMTREGKKRAVIRSGHLSNYKGKAKEEKREFQKLISTLKRTDAPPIEKEKAIEGLIGKFGDYVGEVDLRNATIQELNKIQKTANAKFKKIIKLRQYVIKRLHNINAIWSAKRVDCAKRVAQRRIAV